MTSRQLAALVRREARKLQVGHWEMTARFASLEETHNCAGCCTIQPEYQRVDILIVRPEDLEAAGLEPLSVRETVVHELLHVRLEGHRPQRVRYDPAYELGLNVVAGQLTRR